MEMYTLSKTNTALKVFKNSHKQKLFSNYITSLSSCLFAKQSEIVKIDWLAGYLALHFDRYISFDCLPSQRLFFHLFSIKNLAAPANPYPLP